MKQKSNMLALGVSFGFAGGAILGVLFSMLNKDFAIWLAVCVGGGIIFGAVISFLLDHQAKQK